MRQKRSAGFTLIELMVVVAIIAILAGIAIPSYNDYVRRSKLAEFQSGLGDIRVRVEQYYQDNRTYGPTTDGSACSFSLTSYQGTYFDYACTTSSSGQGFTLTAKNKSSAGLGSAEDYTYTLDQSNAKATTKFKGATQTGKNCWLITGSEC